jgi:hypothetical protein
MVASSVLGRLIADDARGEEELAERIKTAQAAVEGFAQLFFEKDAITE